MAASAEHEVAVYFVAHHHHSGFAGYGSEFGQCVGVPLYSDGVVWVAEHHHLGFVLGHHAAQPVEVHAVALAVEYERVFDYFAIVSFDNGAERRIYRRLNHNTVALAGEEVDSQGYAFHHARHEGKLVAGYGEAVAAQVPVDNRLPVALGGLRVAEHRVCQTAAEGSRYFGAYREVEVGNP